MALNFFKRFLQSLVTEGRRSVVGTVVVNGLSAMLSLGCTVVLARLLGVSQYGLYAYGISVSGLVGALSALGIPTLVLREAAAWATTSQWQLFRGIVRFGIRASFLSSLLFGGLLVGSGPLLGKISHAPGFITVLSLSAVIMLCTTMDQVIESVLQARGKISRSLVPRAIILPVCVLLYAAWARGFNWPLSAKSMLIAQSVISAGVLLWLFRALKRTMPAQTRNSPPIVHPMKWLASAVPFFGNNMMFVINTQVDILLLGYFKGDESAAIYRVGTRGAQILVLCLTAIVTAVQPRMAALFAEGRHRELAALVTRSTRAGFYVAALLGVIFVIFGSQIISALFGRPFVAAATVLSILAICRLAHAGTGSLGAFLSMTGKERILMKALMIESSANVVLNIILIPRWGINGAAFATGVSMAAMNTGLAIYVYKKWGVDVSIRGKYLERLTQT